MPDPKHTYPHPDYGDLMTAAEFNDAVQQGSFIDYDGTGYYANEKVYFHDHPAQPSVIKKHGIDPAFTHVLWFNR